ncbi:MAG: TolB family protein [Cyanobacteria bacterium TGS_CYA1]|nr:TolB family protein [Cyanobacteria bacterium TGS_CYA1]
MKFLNILSTAVLLIVLTGCYDTAQTAESEPGQLSSGAFLYISTPKSLKFESNGLQIPTDLHLWLKDYDSKKKKFLANMSKGATDFCFSSDGKFLVFSSNTTEPGAIYLASTLEGKPKQLTDGNTSVACPILSPDNSKIVYSSWDNDEKWNLHLMNTDGSQNSKLTERDSIDSFPTWSADGKKVIFHSKEENGSWHIYSIDLDGTNVNQLTSGKGMDWLPCASPDGKHIAFWSTRNRKNWEIFLMDTDGNNIRQITNNIGEWPVGSSICPVAWTPDSQKIIFSASENSMNSKIMQLEISTGKCIQLSEEDENYCYAPVWISSRAKDELMAKGKLLITPTSLSLE